MASPLHYLDDSEARERERRAFLDAALDLVARTGTVDLQVAQVVRHAGRHNAAFYRIFGSKERLVLALVEEAVRRTAAVAERQMRDAPTPRDAVRAWARVLLALAKAERAPGVQAIALDRYRLLRRFPDADATIGAPLRRPLQQVLERAGQPCPELLTDACFQLVLSRQAAWIAVGHEPMEEELRAYEDLTVRLAGLSD